MIATYSSDAQPEPTIPFLPILFSRCDHSLVNVYMMSREAHGSVIVALVNGRDAVIGCAESMFR